MSGSDVVGSAGHSHCGLPVAPWAWQGLRHDLDMKEEFADLNVGEEVKLIRIDNNVYLLI